MNVTRSKRVLHRGVHARVAGRRDDVRGNHRAVAGDGHADLDVRVVARGVVRRRPRLLINALDDLRVIRRRRCCCRACRPSWARTNSRATPGARL